MSFKEFVVEQDEHSKGTYVNVKISDLDKNKLYDWVVGRGINEPLDKNEYHTTVIYSRTPCPDAANYEYGIPITGNITGWKIFDAGIGRCLVAFVQSEQLQKINADLQRDYGATSDFPEYLPHITVSYSYIGEIPDDYPAMRITYDQVEVKGLNPDWRPTKKEE